MKYEKITNKEEATQAVLQIRQDINNYTNDTELAKDLKMAKLTLYKRLAFSDWKAHEINTLNELLNSFNEKV
ncbi:hypothetical protein [Empedobacter sp. 189-2]|uniref:hypothetical protein n=1 Tax=Empedobacter sp. 189-2 TaxID=2746724 RepID=UPI0025781A8E|nr:hypothetical protein [Empedobacter sp. 189-2]MDM1542346.1 hypothetical protein [Empedobacter sp. 189-2]